jgi:uncharacterized protein (TIGR03437 family)
LTVDSGSAITTASIAISAPDPLLDVPARLFVKAGSSVLLRVSSAAHVTDGLNLAASALPLAAAFDAASGAFSWTPAASDLGEHRVHFSATDAAGRSFARSVNIYVGTGAPELTGLANVAGPEAIAACTPGSAAALTGRFLADPGEAVTDRSGTALKLNGTAVQINGRMVPVLFAAADRVEFLCPSEQPGTTLEIYVSRGSVVSNLVRTKMETEAPGILTLDPYEFRQALAFHAGPREIVGIATPQIDATPAFEGDLVSIMVAGIDCDGNIRSGQVHVALSGRLLHPTAVKPAGWFVGACELTFVIPPGVDDNNAPLRLEVLRYDGAIGISNAASIAVNGRP